MKEELDTKLVEKYPKIFADRYENMKKTAMCWGFECGDGWYWILDNLCENIQSYIDSNNKWQKEDKQIEQVVATQVKEKWGTLNFYFYGGNEMINGMVRFAESLSSNICEECGTLEDIGRTSGWISYVCKPCFDKTERMSSRTWTPITEPPIINPF